ncbi:N-acetyltransferase ESCO1 [Merluccius polli]|uniref:N-acetyltransferase ESCO1 n=1 Tax=Merluccius polli TaxID=89951 RepID=A0AA47NYM9_MERPO|nr:N-acetyltransferase ESCO1 [Merluccius polli]
MPTEGTLHYKEPCTDFSEVSTHVSSANGQNNVFVSECVAETSGNMDSTATDEQIPGQAQAIMEGGHHRETHPADNSSVDIDTQVPQHVMMNAGSKEGETVSSEYVPEQKTGMEVTTSNMSLPAPTEDLEDKEIQMVNNDCTGMSREAPKHQTLSTSDMVTSDCVGDQDTAPYMEMTETKPDLSNQAQEYENPDKDQCMEQSMGMSEDRAGQLMSKNVEPKEKYVIVSQSIPIQTPQIEAELSTTASLQKASLVPKKEMQTQKNDMAMDKHVFIANSQTSQNEDKINESHAGHGGQTADSFTTSEITDEDGQQKVNSTHLSPEVSTHSLMIISENAVNEDVITSECAAIPEAEPDEDMQTTSTPEEMHEPGTKEHGDQGNHSVDEHTPTEHKQKADMFDKMEASDGVPNSVPAAQQQIQVIHEEPITVEEGCLISNAELLNKKTTLEAVAYVTSGDQREEGEITSMEAKAHSVLEKEKQGAKWVVDEVEVNTPLCSTTRQCEAQVNSEEIVFVRGQQEGDVVVESSTVNKPDAEDVTEQMETVIQSEGEAKDFQVVYEAISSPESTIDEEVSVVPEVPGNILLPDTQRIESQEVEGNSVAISTTSEVNVPLNPTQEADEQINGKTPACLPDSQSDMDIETMICEVTAESSDALPIKHTNGAVDITDVLVEDPESQEVPEAGVLEETNKDNIPEQNIQNTEERREVLVVTTSDKVPEQNIQNTEERREVLVVTTSDKVPEQNIQNTEEREVLVVTTSDKVPEQNIQNTEERREVLVVTTSDKVPEQNIQNTEERREVLVVTTSDEVPEQNIQNTEEIVDVLVETTSNHIPEPSVQKTEEMAEVLVVATSEEIPEPTMQQMEGMGDEKEAIEEANKAPESVELQKDNGPPELSQETLISTAMASSETPDSSSQEEVMESLTIPEGADHMDIITQAAAASGLTTSLSEHLNSDGQMVEADQILNLNGTSQSFYSAIDVHQYQGMDQSTRTSSNEESREDPEVKSATDAAPVALLEKDSPSVPNADQQEEQSAEKKHDATEHEMENPAVCEPQTPAYENASVEMIQSVDTSSENAEGDMQILVDIELGHQVEVQDESEMDDPDIVIIEKSHSAVEMPPVEVENGGEKSPTNNADSTPSNADNSSQKAEETINKTSTPSVTPNPKAEVTVEKPKKQQMNTQARTKARLAALAEQKAAASKRAAQRQQLNLLALCEEIAEDIATDSMLLKRIEEEKLAAAAAAKIEAMKKESPPVDKQEATSVPPSPAGPQASSPLVNTVDEASSAKPTTTTTTAEPAETKPVAPEPPKRRFFVSQIVVPLKAHEKKKLTRYQRLRQVELQREKMSWTRVKKLKTDQAHQMLFSDIDFDSSNPFLMPPVATPLTPVANKPIAADTSTASTSTSTPSTLPATPEVPDAATTKPDQSKAVVTTSDPSPMVMTPDPSTTVTTPDPSKDVTTKPEPKETATPKPGRPRREAATPKVNPAKVECSKVESQKAVPPKVTAAKGPTAKVTRSSTRKTLPAKPPPMPNGMNTQKAKSEMEYKPYRPRPKYSIEDFELDDDPPPVVQRRPMPQPRPGQQAGPSQQSTSTTQVRPTLQSTNPTAQSRTTPPSKPMFSSELAGQTKPKLQVKACDFNSSSVKACNVNSTSVKACNFNSSSVKACNFNPSSVKACNFNSSSVKASYVKACCFHHFTIKAHNFSHWSAEVHRFEHIPVQAVHSKPVAPIISQSKPCIAAAPQPKTTIAATAQPISAVPAKPTQKNQVLDTVGPVPGKALPSGSPAPQTSTAGPTTPQPKPQPGSLKEEVEVKPAVETPAETLVSIPADPQPDVSTETQSVQPPTRPNNFKFQAESTTPLSEASLQKEVKKLREADKDGTQTIIDAGQKHFGAVACGVCGMLYSASNPEDETQHLLFHNQFISAVKYVGWKKERILGEYPDGKIILVLPDDPKYALKKVEEIREMVDNDLGFQQVETKCPSQTKTFLFISNDKKVSGCLIAEHIQEGYRVIEDPAPEKSEREKVMFERQRAWCCSSTSEPAICGISRIWVFSMMRRRGVASRMIECLRNNFIYGSCLGKDELAFSDPTPDGKLFATHYFGTSRFLVYNFVSGTRPAEPETATV